MEKADHQMYALLFVEVELSYDILSKRIVQKTKQINLLICLCYLNNKCDLCSFLLSSHNSMVNQSGKHIKKKSKDTIVIDGFMIEMVGS